MGLNGVHQKLRNLLQFRRAESTVKKKQGSGAHKRLTFRIQESNTLHRTVCPLVKLCRQGFIGKIKAFLKGQLFENFVHHHLGKHGLLRPFQYFFFNRIHIIDLVNVRAFHRDRKAAEQFLYQFFLFLPVLLSLSYKNTFIHSPPFPTY